MRFNRSSGILLHPSSLPSPDGIGDLGKEVFKWIDFLSECGCGLWQVLPLGPTGYGDSPYQCFSAFAGNHYLINIQQLIQEKLIEQTDLISRPPFEDLQVDFGTVITWKNKLLKIAFNNFQNRSSKILRKAFDNFIQKKSYWLEDYSLFMAIKEAEGGKAWNEWGFPLRSRDPIAVRNFLSINQENVLRHKFNQFIFSRQWEAILKYAHKKKIRIIGDVPIFVSYDSADAWSHPELFYMDDKFKPILVSGVPPDYFSPTGQLWGNPIYQWDVHEKTGFSWWVERIKSSLELVDIIRLDHFRGFLASWQIKYGKKTAEKGRWVTGPGDRLFEAFEKELGNLPIIAEDLGVITPDVIALREKFGFPGMLILQFAFNNDPETISLPHHFTKNCVVYTGTHDNNTVQGWYQTASEVEKDFCRRYMARSGNDISWDFIRSAWSSAATFAIAQMQDFLSLGSEARMNFPGKASGNWTWRMSGDALSSDLKKRIREYNYLYDRLEK